MRSLNTLIGTIVLIFLAVNGFSQAWQTIRFVDFEDGSNGSQSDLEYYDARFGVTGPYEPGIHYGDNALTFTASTVSPYTLETPEPVGFRLQLSPDFEYRFTLSVETWSGNDIGFYLEGPDQQEVLLNGPVATQQRNPNMLPYNDNPRDFLQQVWSVYRNSEAFTVPSEGEYFIYIRHFDSSVTYNDETNYGSMYDIYDLFRFESRPLNNITTLSFSETSNQTVTEGGSTALCIDIENPSSSYPTEVDITLFSDAEPHFSNFSPLTVVFPAGSSEQQCIQLDIPFTSTSNPSTFYEFDLQNGVNQHMVELITPTSLTVEVLQANGITISSPNSVTVTEGSNTEICVQLQQTEFTYTTVELAAMSNPNPHFSNNDLLAFNIPPGQLTACRTVAIPFFNDSEPTNYTFELRNAQGNNIIINSPDELQISVVPDPDNNCWESLLLESFSTSDHYDLSNLTHLSNSGYIRSNYGASGNNTDVCAKATNLSSSYHLGLIVDLIGGHFYRLAWNGKANNTEKSVDLYIGTSPSDLAQESGPYLVPVRGLNETAAATESETFTVPSSGQYYIVLKKSSSSSSSGNIRLDDLELEHYCGATQPSTFRFSESNHTVAEGGSVDICVQMTNPSGFGSTSVDVAVAGNSSPHLTSFTTTPLTFPTGDGTAQCFTIQLPANGELNGDVTYQLILENPNGPNSPELIEPDTLLLLVEDDIDLGTCNTWDVEGDTIIFDNYAYNLPSGFIHNPNSFMDTAYPDYSGDKSFYGVYGTSFYLGIPFVLNPAYEYRLRWHSKGYRNGNLYALSQEVDFGTSLSTATTLAGTFDTNMENVTAVVSPTDAGTYYFIIKGAEYTSQAEIFLDDIVLERRCKNTEVNFVAMPNPVLATEGNAFTVCLNIATPSPYQATTVTLGFNGNATPHFSQLNAPLTVTFPAGSTSDQCIDIPSQVFQGADPHSEYLMEINHIEGGIHPQIGSQSTKILQVDEAIDCWETLMQQDFQSANSSLTNLLNLVENTTASRDYYGASGSSGDRCAKVLLNYSNQYFGFSRTLEAGKQYRVKWNLKPMSYEKEIYLSVSSSTGIDQPIGMSRTAPVIAASSPGIAIQYEYFTVPSDGTYQILLRSNDGPNGYIKLDDFVLEERCPPTEVFFTQSTATIEEGLPLEVCVDIANPSLTEDTYVEVGFKGSQYPHFANSSTQTVHFPPGSTTQQCVIFSSIGNGSYDESLPTYSVELRNPSGEHGPVLGTPKKITVTLEDDVDLSICEWAGPDVSICAGDFVQLGVDYSQTFLFQDCVSGNYCFSWKPANQILFDGQHLQQPYVSPDNSTWFVIYMTDGQGNLFQDSVFVEVSHGPDFNINSARNYLCTGDSLRLTSDIQQGSGNYTYAWSNGATTQNIYAYTGGTYALSITDLEDGCTSSQTIEIAEPDVSFMIAANTDFICSNSPNSILSVPGTNETDYNYLWSNAATTPTTTVSASGDYQLTLTDAIYGCDTVMQYTIQDVDLDLSLAITAIDTVLCEDDSKLLDATITGLTVGEDAITYLWSDDQTTPSISVNQPGTYTVTVTFGSTCTLDASITLTQPALDFTIISTSGEVYACPESPLTLTTSTSDPTNIIAWAWSTGESSPEATVTAAGDYSVTVTDLNGCPFVADFTVEGCPTIVFFEQDLIEIRDDEIAEICVGLVNPGTDATTVDVVFAGSQSPHFTDMPASQTVTFASGEMSHCLTFVPVKDEDADDVTVYPLQLANVTGGNSAALGLVRETELAVESAVRCQVDQDDLPVNCELSDESTIVSDVPLIERLEEEDSFWAGDFEVIVESATGEVVFNGNGIIRIPYFNQVQVNVRMDNIQINEDCQMVAGEVVVLGVGAELLSDELQDALDDLLGTLDDIENVITVIDEVLTTVSDVVNTSSQIGDVLSEDWNVLHGSDPLYDEYPYLPDSLAQDLDEAILCYLVNPPSECSDQLAEVIDAVTAAINEMFEADYALRFNPYEPQSYGFDSLMYDPMADDYNRLTVAEQAYNVAWKSVESGMSDHVLLDREFDDLPTDLTFEKNDRSTLQPENHNGHTRLPIMGLTHEEVYQIYPVQNKLDENDDPVKKYAGKLNVVSYDRKEVDVVLVPVNGAIQFTETDRANIENNLNNIYKGAVVSFDVELNDNLDISTFDNILDTVGSSLLRNYNPEMLSIKREFNLSYGSENEKYYIFFVNSVEGNLFDGYMPFSRPYGFVAANNSNSLSDLSRTIAHELGHGAFLLNHTFDEYDTEVGSTSNLMDYGGGTHLSKSQWNLIHNPPIHISLFDNDDEARQVTLLNIVEHLGQYITEHNDSLYLTFVNNHGQPIHLNVNNLQNVTFATGGESYNAVNEEGELVFIPVGTMTHFSIQTPESDEDITYRNCADGLYYRMAAKGNCLTDYGTYENPQLEQYQSILLRHGLKNEAADQNILHFVQLDEENIPTETESQSVLAYDFFIDSFFDIDNKTVKHPENIITVSLDHVVLDDAFALPEYLEFINSDFGKIEYDDLRSFYTSGFAVLIKDLIGDYEANCDPTGLERAIGFRIGLNAAAETLNPTNQVIHFNPSPSQLSKTAALISTLFSHGFYENVGLPEDEIAKRIVNIILHGERVEKYNEILLELNPGDTPTFEDIEHADEIVNLFFDPENYLFPCEFNALSFTNYEALELVISRYILHTHYRELRFPLMSDPVYISAMVGVREEWILLKLLNKIPQENYNDFFDFFQEIMPETDEAYWEKVFWLTDNDLLDSNGEHLMNWVKDAWVYIINHNANSEISQVYHNLKNDIEEINDDDLNILQSTAKLENLPIVAYNYTPFLNRINYWEVFECGVYMGGGALIGGAPGLFTGSIMCSDNEFLDNTDITDVEAITINYMGGLDKREIRTYQRNKYLFMIAETQDRLTITKKPFDPIILDAASSYAVAKKELVGSTEDFLVMPAIFLYYLEENAQSQTTEDLTFFAIDAATLGWPITKLVGISRTLAYLDKASSALGIAGQYYQGEAPTSQLGTFFNLTSALFGMTGLVPGVDVTKNTAATKINTAYASANLSDAIQYEKFEDLIDYVQGPNYSASEIPSNLREIAARQLLNNQEALNNIDSDIFSNERIQEAINLLEFVDLIGVRQALETALNSIDITDYRLVDVFIESVPSSLQQELKQFLTEGDYTDALRSFHNSLDNDTPVNSITMWVYLRNLENAEAYDSYLMIERLVEDVRLHGDDLLSFLQQGENISIWNIINKVLGGTAKQIAEWLENLWIRGQNLFQIVPSSSSSSGESLTFKFDGYDIAYINNGILDYSVADNLGAIIPDEIKLISDDGSFAIAHRSGVGSCVKPGQCFPAGTLIKTPNGISPIESLSIGDHVISYDEIKQDTVIGRIKNTVQKTAYELRRILVGTDTLFATQEHPFFIPSLRRYLPADSLRQGMKILTLASTLLTVQSVAAIDTTVAVYNFEVEEYHNYFVGEEGVLVHNSDPVCFFTVSGLDKDITKGWLGNDITKLEFLDRDLAAAFNATPRNELFIDFFRAGGDIVLQERRVRAWEMVRESDFSTNVAALQKVDEHLSHFDNGAIGNRVQDLRTAFVNAANQAGFIDNFIGGPLLKSELEELNNLYYRQASTYDDGPGELLPSSELQRIDDLENQLGSYEHPNTISTDSPQVIGNTSTAPQPSPENFWADVKVADGKIEGLIPEKKYDYVITYPFDGSSPELRLGLGHYKISGNALAVKGAGSLRFNAEGKIYYINRQSGHYISIPNSNLQGELDETVNILNANGLTVPDIDVDYNL